MTSSTAPTTWCRPSRAARVVTVHDLTPLRYPDMCDPETLAFPDLIRRAAANGAWIHTDSAAVRSELLDTFDLDAERVVAVPLGHTDRAGGDPARGHSLAGTDPFVLAVGTVEPRKDLPSLVRAIDLLATADDQIPLVHVGPDGWGTEALDRGDRRPPPARPDRTAWAASPMVTCGDLYAAARVVAYPVGLRGLRAPGARGDVGRRARGARRPFPPSRRSPATPRCLVPVGDADALADRDRTRSGPTRNCRAALIAAGHGPVPTILLDACVDGIVRPLPARRRCGADMSPGDTFGPVRALVTGSLGFAGTHLCAHLRAQGDEVVGIDRDDADLTDPDGARTACCAAHEPEVVYHLAGAADVGASWRDPVGTFEANATATLYLLEAARAHGVRRVLVVSSADVYGTVAEDELPLDEDVARAAHQPLRRLEAGGRAARPAGLARARPRDDPGPGVQPHRPRPAGRLRGAGPRHRDRPQRAHRRRPRSRSATSRPAATSPTSATSPAPTGC